MDRIIIFVQQLNCVCFFLTPWTVACQASLSISSSQSLLRLMSIELMMTSNYLFLCCPLLLPSVFASIRVFSIELAPFIRWPKYWSLSISPSNEYSWLISFGTGCFDFLAVQGTFKSLLQHRKFKSINSSTFSLLYGPVLISKVLQRGYLVFKPRQPFPFRIYCNITTVHHTG